jgi:hypothetical protein
MQRYVIGYLGFALLVAAGYFGMVTHEGIVESRRKATRQLMERSETPLVRLYHPA